MTWGEQFAGPASGYMPLNNLRASKSAPCSPIKPVSSGPAQARVDPFHVVHKVPVGDSPYVKAKHVQLVDRDPDRAIALFWAAINSGDRVDSALKDMAIVMKQQNRPQEAIEAIKSLRGRCSDQAQESLDNVLLDLFKRCGRIDDQIDLLKRKLHLIHQGMAFNGKRTKTARSQGKKFQVSVEQEATRLLGNLGWAYMQQSNFVAAEAVYRKALSIESDNNKVCNLGICLMKQGRLDEAKVMLQSVTLACHDIRWTSESHLKSFERAQEMLDELEKVCQENKQSSLFTIPGCETEPPVLSPTSPCPPLWQPQPAVPRQPRRLSRSEQQLCSQVEPALTGALYATSGFGPLPPDHTHSSRLDMAGCFRIPQPAAKSFQSQWWLQGGLEDDDSCDYSSPDESSDGSAKTSSFSSGSIEDEEIHWNVQSLLEENTAEALNDTRGSIVEADSGSTEKEFSSTVRDLARSLELVQPLTARESSSSTNTLIDASDKPVTSDVTNGDPVATVMDETRRAVKPPVSAGMWSTPFRITNSAFDNNWNRVDHDGNQSATTLIRSPAIEYGGTQSTESSASDVSPHVTCVGLPPLHVPPLKQPIQAAIQKKTTTTTMTASTWDLMGFTYNPSELAFGRMSDDEIGSPSNEHDGLNIGLSASEMEMRRQRRLRVFQEMTPTKTLQV